MPELKFLDRDGRRLAYRFREGDGPAIIFLPGYMSDMDGTKALALDAWAEAQGRAMLRFDYGGCGQSEGAFEDQALSDWWDDTLHVIDTVVRGPCVIVGSSMGGWLMLLTALARSTQVKGLVGIAAAPDFTSWGFSDSEKATIRGMGRLEEASPHGDQPYVTTRTFWESGEKLKLLEGPIDIRCPVRLLHGLNDDDVPFAISLNIMDRVRSSDVQATLIKDGDHRLSRDSDIALLIRTVGGLLEAL
ncbi:alpha/beta fold hydrolase [Allosphingosinicella vermicomposti]|uniref:alpha/beta fold hydrolase n=1 Tax=Allosphingosinicella vermicomposti TaxID=614671 RepID=UPI000D0FFD20|nr:alpha/beta hydrolase [Allosphingosinicella vermicomposti]